MNADDLILVSVDDHLIEPAHMFEGRVPKKYEDSARPSFVRREDGTMAWRYEGQEILKYGAQRGRRPPANGIRHGTDLHRRDPARLLRHSRPSQGHERQRRARVDVFPVVPPVLRAAVLTNRGSRAGRRDGACV